MHCALYWFHGVFFGNFWLRVGRWGGCGCAHLGVHNHRLFTNHRETLPRKQTATLSFFPSLPPPQLGHLKLIECENYFFIF